MALRRERLAKSHLKQGYNPQLIEDPVLRLKSRHGPDVLYSEASLKKLALNDTSKYDLGLGDVSSYF